MSQCKIYLENYNGVYYPGAEIIGKLECYFNEDITVRGIKIRVKCEEKNQWMGSEEYREDNQTKTRYVQFTGDHDVLRYEQILFGSDSGSRDVGRGRQVYPFRVVLPDNIPSTYNGPHGSITYSIKGIVDRPMRTDYEDKFFFVVNAPIDFNKMPKNLQDEITFGDEKTVCCWCCAGGVLTVEVMLPREAFCVGETIDYKINITNLTNTNVDSIKVKLTKKIVFKVTNPSHEEKDIFEEIYSYADHGVGAHGEHTYDLHLTIPEHVEVPNFSLCNLFKSDYKFLVTVEFDGCAMDLDVEFWPTIGHIPYRQIHQNTAPQAVMQTGNMGFVSPGAPPMTEGAYPPPIPPIGGMPVYPPMPGYPPYPAGGKAAEAIDVRFGGGAPSAPSAPMAPMGQPELPPPSYEQVQKQSGNIPPYPTS